MTEGINYRRKAQNQKYELARLNKKCAQQQAEIEKLKKGWKADVIETQNIKAEAIKEFAERLKCKKATFYCICGVENDYTDILNTHIDNLVAEMVGEGK